MRSPDPIISASIYCDRRLDAVVREVARPWLERLRAAVPTAEWALWCVRYTRNGEHLKVRLHGPAEETDRAKELLATLADSFFASLPALDPTEERRDRPRAPAIDPEDDGTEIHPDRALRWTSYRRSPVTLGPLLLEHDDYVACMTACLATGAEMVLDPAVDERGAVLEGDRQRKHLTAVIAGLGGAPFTPEERAYYLEYHRDWVLRFATTDSAQEGRLREAFARRVAGMEGLSRQLGMLMEVEWAPGAEPADEGAEARLRVAVRELCACGDRLGLRVETLGDPNARHAAYPLALKSLHGIANEGGVDLATEAFLYHLLAHAASGMPCEAAA